MLEDFHEVLNWTRSVNELNESLNLWNQILPQFDCMVGLTVHYLDYWEDFADYLCMTAFVDLEFLGLLGH